MDKTEEHWFEELGASVETDICGALLSDTRFVNPGTLVDRFQEAAARLRDRGVDHLNEFREVVNELGVAHRILATEEQPTAASLEYEPALEGCDQRIDFRVRLDEEGTLLFVEVKTIHPDFKDNWDKFRWVLENDLLPPNVRYHLDEDWLGGELWHFRVASRSKMLAYSLDFEERIRNCLGLESGAVSCLALCGDGSRWHLDELQDFVAYYRFGSHRQDDALGRMEAHYVRENNLQLDRSIHHFAQVVRSDSETLPHRFAWSVTSPDAPWGRYGL